MKFNIEIDLTPEELRTFFGLPDVQGFQQQMLEQYTASFGSTQEQQEEFVRNLIAGSMAPWQGFFDLMSGAATSRSRVKTKQKEK